MTHRDINNCLVLLVGVIACFILLAPFLPQLDYIMGGAHRVPVPAFVGTATAQGDDDPSTDNTNLQGDNQLYIPKIGVLAPILDGKDSQTVDKGLWRRPLSSTPGQQSNTVIVGHRFTYNHSIVQPFYHLDKLEAGDKIYILWNGQKHVYTVSDKKIVKNTQVSVEAPTKNEQLTLYTCTPIWNPVDRLVITALPDSGASNE